MRIAGRRIKKTRRIHTDRYVVAVEVEAVIPPDAETASGPPGEPPA